MLRFGTYENLWSATGKIILEREFWIAVMKAQQDLGVEIGDDAIEASQKVKGLVDLEAIEEREKITKHDVKALGRISWKKRVINMLIRE